MPRKLRRSDELCAYCGINYSTRTGDHPVPRCLFLPPLPNNMVTVPACLECNFEKSKDDDFLRDMIAVDIFCSSNPTVQQLLGGPVQRSAGYNSSEIARITREHASLKPLHTPNGIYLGKYPSIPLDGERVQRIYAKMVRGLYYKLRQERLSADYVYDVQRILIPQVGAELRRDLIQAGANGPYLLEDVFGCVFFFAAEDPFITYWLLWFYDCIFITVSTGQPA